jgi:hypothetical protein
MKRAAPPGRADRAYLLFPKHGLAQLAATGCFNGTFYAQLENQIATLLEATHRLRPPWNDEEERA